MEQPVVVLTNFLLAVECLGLAVALQRRAEVRPDLRRLFMGMFLFVAVGAVLGGLSHGLGNRVGSLSAWILWRATLIALGGGAFCAARIAVEELAPHRRPFARRICSGLLLAYVLAVLAGATAFAFALLPAVLATAMLLMAYLRRWHRLRSPGVAAGIAGLSLVFLAGVQQQLEWGVDPDGFNHNAVYHLLQMIALALIHGSVPAFSRLA